MSPRIFNLAARNKLRCRIGFYGRENFGSANRLFNKLPAKTNTFVVMMLVNKDDY